jgi:hypothetical protein
MPRSIVLLLAATQGLLLAGCASSPVDGIPPAERAMLEAEAKAGMNANPGEPVSVDAMLAGVRDQGAATEVTFPAGLANPLPATLRSLEEARPSGAAVGRISVGGSAGLAPIEGAALALRRGRVLAEALGEPGATQAYDPRLVPDTARIDWLTGASGGG